MIMNQIWNLMIQNYKLLLTMVNYMPLGIYFDFSFL